MDTSQDQVDVAARDPWVLAVLLRMREYRGHWGTHVKASRGGAPYDLALAVGAIAWGPEPWIWYVPPEVAERLEVGEETPARFQVWAGARHLNGRALALQQAHPGLHGRDLWRGAARLALRDQVAGDSVVSVADLYAGERGRVVPWDASYPRLIEAPDDRLRRRIVAGAVGAGALARASAVFLSWPRPTSPLPGAHIPT